MRVRNGRPLFTPGLGKRADPVDLCNIDLHADSVLFRGFFD